MRPPSVGIIHVHVAIQHARDSFRTTPDYMKRIYGPIPRWGSTSPPVIALKRITRDKNWEINQKYILYCSGAGGKILYNLPEELKKYIEGAPNIPFSFSFNSMVTAGRLT